MKRFVGIPIFVVSMILSLTFFASRFEHAQKRSTASEKNNYDLTCLSGDELKNAIANRIVTGFKGTRREGYMGISIGHYTYSDSEADKKMACSETRDRSISSTFSVLTKKMACELYPKLNLKFIADGETASGSKRELQVEAPCSVSSDLSKTDTVWIPWNQLAHETPFEGISEYTKPSKVTVKTSNISDKWPDKWILESIQMEGSSGSVFVDAAQIKEYAGRPLVFEFN